MGVQLTPGQRCLLDLLQRKLTSTIETYARLARKKQEEPDLDEEVELELQRLKEKIRRISSRQKRFTLEIINGNGNNTIPKESFFEALGLITKETLVKLNSKTNERRRRTTANPRFSHEAIQAKKALEPLQRRLDSRVGGRGGDNKRPDTGRRQQQQQQQQTRLNSDRPTPNRIKNNATNNIRLNNNNSGLNSHQQSRSQNLQNANNSQQAFNNNIDANRIRNNNNNERTPVANVRQQQQQHGSSSGQTSNRRGGDRLNRNRNSLIQNELLAAMQREINSKVSQIQKKRESNKELERRNELIRRRGLEIISAINLLKPDQSIAIRQKQQQQRQQQLQLQRQQQLLIAQQQQQQSQQQIIVTSREDVVNNLVQNDCSTNINNNVINNNQVSEPQQAQPVISSEPMDMWIDMKCEESLDGLD